MNALTVNHSYRYLALYQHDTEAKPTARHDSYLDKQTQQTPSSYVKLSNEAKEKYQQEKNSFGKELAQQINAQKSETTEKIEAATQKDGLDTMIEQIQQLIKDIQKRLRSLRNKNSEAAKAEIKMLEAQLLNLNATLMALIGKKFDATSA